MKNYKRNKMNNSERSNEVWLTPHFTLREMTASGTAVRRGLKNVPPAVAVENLRALCREVLEPLRRQVGCVRVTSGYRSEALNRAVGGAENSQHRRGEAADVHCSSLEQAKKWFEIIRRETDFDQLLLERHLKNGCCWLHVSYVRQPGRRKNRHKAHMVSV